MDYKRIFRAAVCLLVVCCLVCNCALPSQATGVELIVGTAISVAAVAAVGSMLVGLGVSPGSDQTVFDDLVNGAVDMFEQAGKVVGGMMSVWSLTNSSVKYAVEPEIIEMLREWIQGLGILSEKTVSLSAGYSLYGNWYYYSIPASFLTSDLPYIIIGRTSHDNKYRLIFSSKPLFVGSMYSNYYHFLRFGCDAGTSIKQCTVDTSLANKWVEGSVYTKDSQLLATASSNTVVSIAHSEYQSNFWSNYDIYGTSAYNSGALIFEGKEAITESGTYVTLADDYTAGYIAPSTDTLADGYADWAANSITLPGSEADEEDRVLWPMGLGPDYLGTISKPQPDIWDGTSEYEIPNGITGVSIVSPDSVTTGSYIVIQADVAGSGEYDNVCSCTVTGATSANTKISSMEFENSWSLECGADEDAQTLTVTVTSVADPAIAVTKEIAVVKSETEPGTDTEVETGTYTGILGMIQAGVDRVAEWCSVLVDEVVEIPNKIVEGVKSIFVPSEDFLTAKVESLRAEFAFADSVISAGELVGSTLQSLETEPPVIYIDLSSARGSFAPGGKYPLGGKEVFIDMSWYAEYKPVGDALLSALLWIAFIWRMFIKLPGIISGMPGDFVMDGLHHIGLADRLPSRTASYEVQRISNRQSLRKGPGR